MMEALEQICGSRSPKMKRVHTYFVFTGITKEMPLPIIEKIFLISSVMIKEGKMINDDLVAIGLL